MLKNYIKIAVRNLFGYKGYSLINIFGLTVGFAGCLVIFLYVNNQLSYDDFYEDADQVYRLTIENVRGADSNQQASTPAMAAPLIEQDFPMVESVARIFPTYGANILINNVESDVKYFEEKVLFADQQFADIFSLEILSGNQSSMLEAPNGIVLTRSMAEKYFPNGDALGKTLAVTFFEVENEYTVTGVIKNLPDNTHLDFEILLPFSFIENLSPTQLGGMVNYVMNWENSIVFTYMKLTSEADPELVEEMFINFIKTYRDEEYASSRIFHLQPLENIYMQSGLANEIAVTGNMNYVYIFSVIAFFVLFIACINFVNLSTAQASRRTKEIAIRKASGAERSQLTLQYLGESMLISLLTIPIVVLFVELILPLFNNSLDLSLQFNVIAQPELLLILIAAALATGLISGLYPAFYLSSISTTSIFKNKSSTGGKQWVRKSLVVFQFAASIVLLVGTLVINSQLDYIRSKDPGFNKEQVLVIPVWDQEVIDNITLIKDRFESQSGVTSVAASSFVPGSPTPGRPRIIPEGEIQANTTEDYVLIKVLQSDYEFLETMDIELVDGRNFSREYPSDPSNAFLINQSAREYLGWENPLGKTLERQVPAGNQGWVTQKSGQVIGVVEDFNFESLHSSVTPLIITMDDENEYGRLSVKLTPGNLSETVDDLQGAWSSILPSVPMEFNFLDQEFNNLYRSEERMNFVFTLFAGFALVIACVGLLGLVAFVTSQRTKEIGVRKVLGASIPNVVTLLCKDFLKLVLIGFMVAVPISWYAMNSWLSNFAYRIEVGPGIFLLAGSVAVFIALATISWQSVRAAVANPADSLRSE